MKNFDFQNFLPNNELTAYPLSNIYCKRIRVDIGIKVLSIKDTAEHKTVHCAPAVLPAYKDG